MKYLCKSCGEPSWERSPISLPTIERSVVVDTSDRSWSRSRSRSFRSYEYPKHFSAVMGCWLWEPSLERSPISWPTIESSVVVHAPYRSWSRSHCLDHLDPTNTRIIYLPPMRCWLCKSGAEPSRERSRISWPALERPVVVHAPYRSYIHAPYRSWSRSSESYTRSINFPLWDVVCARAELCIRSLLERGCTPHDPR